MVVIIVRNTEWVRLFCGSWDVLKLRDVCKSRSDVIFVDYTFFCCVWRWPLLVASDLVKCLVTREVVRPGQDSNWTRSMARKQVDGTGLYIAACRNIARSSLVVALSWMAPLAR